MVLRRILIALALSALVPASARADVPPGSAEADEPLPFGTFRAGEAELRVSAYAEVYGQWNANAPWNRITAYRGFDNRADTFSLTNASIALDAAYMGMFSRLALQFGLAPGSYYASEPTYPAYVNVSASGPDVWKYLQEAYVGYQKQRFAISGGIFLSPIGPENLQARLDPTFSRSNLFFGLPYYHTGVRGSVKLTSTTKLVLYVVNGWNSVVDGNRAKSVALQLELGKRRHVSGSLMYFGGIERNAGDPAGTPWRNLLDGYVVADVRRAQLTVHADVGLERGNFGRSAWAAAAVTAKVPLSPIVYAAMRGDVFYEHDATSSQGTASPIFFPSRIVGSGTVTLGYEPVPYFSVRLEYRHDHATSAMYFGRVQAVDNTGASVPTERRQNTITAAMIAGF